jgi:hypothetical protein
MLYSVDSKAKRFAVPRFLKKSAVVVLCMFVLTLSGGISAQAQSAGGAAIAQGFVVDGALDNFVTGALVSVKSGSDNTVQLATEKNATQLVGVVSKTPLVALSNGEAEVQVIINGSVSALVSDINGAVKAGDKITVSPIAGVGMRATANAQVVGTAQADFDSVSTTAQTIKDTSGNDRTVHLGRVPLQVNVSYYQSETSGLVPPFIQGVANSLAGRPVSLIRILVCTVLLLLAFATSAIVLYTSVRSGIISIGRNPLAAKAIRRGLLQVGLALLLVLGLTLLASYLILTI